MKNYIWKSQLNQLGFEESASATALKASNSSKVKFVNEKLSAVINATGEWHHCTFVTCVHKVTGETCDYVKLLPDESETGGRYVCVEGDSNYGILCDVVDNMG